MELVGRRVCFQRGLPHLVSFLKGLQLSFTNMVAFRKASFGTKQSQSRLFSRHRQNKKGGKLEALHCGLKASVHVSALQATVVGRSILEHHMLIKCVNRFCSMN